MRPAFVITPGFLKRGLLLFWAAWFSVVTATNVCDALQELGLLGPGWRFASGNFAFLAETTARYHVAPWLNATLFLGVITWEATAAALFWLTWRQTRHVPRKCAAKDAPYLYPAFLAGLMLWAAFLLADELLIAYAVEAAHLRLFTAQLASMLAIVLLPEPERSVTGDASVQT